VTVGYFEILRADVVSNETIFLMAIRVGKANS
jgi:hypothetical protein